MRRRVLVLLATLAPLSAAAVPPDFSKGGLLFSIQPGYGLWGVSEPTLATSIQPDYAQTFVSDLHNTIAASLTLGYNILGHATLGAEFTATGWNIFDANRGGAGFLAGVGHWHPLEIFLAGKERPFDFSLFFGVGYGIEGQTYGMDGLIVEAGVDGDYYFAPGFAVGVFARWIFLEWHNFYLNYDQRSQPGNTLPVSGSIGDYFTIGLELKFRFIP